MDLSKAAMLVSVTIINGGLLGERRDATATSYVERKFNLGARNRAKASKFLIDRKHPSVKAVVAASQRVREVLYKYTMPWGDDKTRLLPVKVHDTFKQKMSDAEVELRQAWEDYLNVYPSLVADSERELGNLFDRSQYPSVASAGDRFRFNLNYWPMPSAGHFVAEIAKEEVAKATAQMRLEIETRLQDSASELVSRAKEVVVSFIEKLEGLNAGAAGHTLRDSLLETMRETSKLINDMNITGNRDIGALANSLYRLSNLISGNGLRNNSIYRIQAKTKANAIMAEMDRMSKLDTEIAEMTAEASEYEF